jgi:hypothetical protein
MPYKIKWKTGGETAELYSTKSLANKILKRSRLSGSIKSAILKKGLRTAPFSQYKYGSNEVIDYPYGDELVWVKNETKIGRIKGNIYRTRAKHRLQETEKVVF